ncbi:MAG: hypothetical protein HHJ16_08940 [Polaromonas sp.]|uniref:hypothetical protein n=1 Tax=Polaromonas sp. TaxID=1869339 RepID=UPI0017A3DCA9|nr:hypothetical protein [Polaromonas sp.]NMM10386.1 hypothetical protein [Polaromonas sp.]
MTVATRFCPSQFNRLGKGVAYLGLAISLTLTVASAQIASGTTGIDATGNEKSEMAACNSGKTQQNRATCITEVKNANAAKRAGKLDNNGGQFSANALKRCDVFKGDDQAACKARIDGDVKIQGSVAEGGVIRELETVVAPVQP